MTIRPENIMIEHNAVAERFEAKLDNQLAVLEYQRQDGTLFFTHTEVPPKFRGQGIADELAKQALDYARTHQLTVVPLCSFMATYIRRHPEYKDLVQNLY
ncbi:MAG: GNAT family N-acetyltransferase [Caldilineaceae bacterium]